MRFASSGPYSSGKQEKLQVRRNHEIYPSVIAI